MGEIMSRHVEITDNDARPLVKVYTGATAEAVVRRVRGPRRLQAAADRRGAAGGFRVDPQVDVARDGGPPDGLERHHQGDESPARDERLHGFVSLRRVQPRRGDHRDRGRPGARRPSGTGCRSGSVRWRRVSIRSARSRSARSCLGSSSPWSAAGRDPRICASPGRCWPSAGASGSTGRPSRRSSAWMPTCSPATGGSGWSAPPIA